MHAHAGTERVAQRTMHHAIQAVHILGGKGVAQKRLALMALLEKLDIALVEGRKRPHSLEGSGEHVAETVLHQVILVGEVVIEGLLAHAGRGGDLGDAHLVERLAFHQARERIRQQPLRIRHESLLRRAAPDAAFDTFIVVNAGGFQRKCRRTFGERRGRAQRAAIQ